MGKISTFGLEDYLSAYFNDVLVDKDNNDEKLLIGELYTINSSDSSINNNIYKIIKIIYEVNDVEINSCVVKRMDNNENDCIFSLTKSDCNLIGIDFQEKLELLPLSLDWKLVNSNKFNGFFDENDLSTYPIDYNTKTIKGIIIKIDMGNLLENNIEFSELYQKCKADLAFKLNNNALYNGYPLSRYFNIKYRVMTNKISLNRSPYDNLIDLDGCIYVEIIFYSKSNKNIGILPQLIKDKAINDIIISEIILTSKNNDEELKKRMELLSRLKDLTLSKLYENQYESSFEKKINFLRQQVLFYD